jgi:hypothetical protein
MSDAKLFEKINENRLKRVEKVSAQAYQEYKSLITSNSTNRVVAAVPIK